MASSLRGAVLSFVLIAAVAVTLAQEVNDNDFSIGTTNKENGLAKQGNVTVLANSTDSNTPPPAATANNETTPANATAATNTTEANNATADANSTAIANSSNITLSTIEPQWWMNLSEFSMPPDLLSENNTEVRTFQSQIPIVEATNETDPSNATAIADTITKVNILIKFDLVHKFKGGHGIYFRHKMWTHLLEELRKGLAYLKRVLQARIAARDGEAVKLKLALTRVSNALRRIKELKAQHEALGVDLTILRKMATMMSNKNLSERLRVELHDAEKIASDRHLEAKKARETVLGARNRLDKALKRFVAVIQRVVGKFVYSQQVMELLNPIHDYGLQSALDLMRHSIKTKKAQITQIEALVDSATTDAIRVRGSEFNLRSQQVTHFTDEVLQEQRKVALYTKLLAQARDRLKEIDTNTTVTPVASS